MRAIDASRVVHAIGHMDTKTQHKIDAVLKAMLRL